jgi:hypothetical protein
MRSVRCNVLLAGLLILVTSGIGDLLPRVIDLSQSSLCPRCAVRNCSCRDGCCGKTRCHRPKAPHGMPQTADETESRGGPLWGSRCSSGDDGSPGLPPGTRLAVASRTVTLLRPDSGGSDFEVPPSLYEGAIPSPPTPPPRSLR